MFKRLGFLSDEMALAITLWLCSLPLVVILVVPFFGLKLGGLAALAREWVAFMRNPPDGVRTY